MQTAMILILKSIDVAYLSLSNHAILDSSFEILYTKTKKKAQSS